MKSTFEGLLTKDGSFTVHQYNIQTLARELYKVYNNISEAILGELFTRNNKQLLSHGGECNMGNIFRVSHILQLIKAKYEKRGKYLPILHEAACDNYFIVKCLSK